MKKFKFNKEAQNRWYIELPEWTGSKSELEMVFGADTLLNFLAEGKKEVVLNTSKEYFNNSDCMQLTEICPTDGAYYQIDFCLGKKLNMEVWLCDVTKFVLGDFPEKIYFMKFNVK